MLRASIPAALFLFAAMLSGAEAQTRGRPAKQFFGQIPTAAPIADNVHGTYTKGCFAGGEALPVDGAAWQAMRLSRNRNWGLPVLVAYIERLANDSVELDGWPGLLVGDMSQPRGGPMVSGHASHQTGLDVDIWFDPMPDRVLTPQEREKKGARTYIQKGTYTKLDESMWTEGHSRLIKRAASYPEVQRIFVNPGIKKALCDWAGDDRAWLRKIRPWYRHTDHMHTRLRCPDGMAGCTAQGDPPAGDSCGEPLASWLDEERYKPKPQKGPFRYKPEMVLNDLPAACRSVLAAGEDGINVPLWPWAPLPNLRPAIN